MGGKKTEACGRCSMSTVVDVASSGDDDDGGGEATRDPFGESAIEVDDETLRRVSPGAWAGRVTDRLDDLGRRLIYGR
ncbi:hypothetical protein CP556_13220 [Natrinema sp. CBA1119]|uniref:hypothetical protein n=1 Tax=Natrinema sp. CBA1119 TaxID=1608465 RepID=UPI000BF34DE8|nr:hypothetical protein [Natrinema sp. CBA1119]PGF16986.1 hypothetical protein CP556_13220 [Natrinema sp. CBA1119]